MKKRHVGVVVALLCAAASATSCRSMPNAVQATSTVRAPLSDLERVPSAAFCVTDGKLTSPSTGRMHVDAGGMRAVIARDRSRSAELAFTYRGPSATEAPLASGELRRQLGLKLRAQDTCNVVYVMWHVEPSPGVFVLVKRNPGASTHAECRDGGYQKIEAETSSPAPRIERGSPHVLRADVDSNVLRVTADDIVVWSGPLPATAFTFDGPSGIRSDNSIFDFELRLPGGSKSGGPCPAR